MHSKFFNEVMLTPGIVFHAEQIVYTNFLCFLSDSKKYRLVTTLSRFEKQTIL